MKSDRITDLDERIKVLHVARFPAAEGWGRTVWFSKMLMEHAGLERTPSAVFNWKRAGVPESVARVVFSVIGALADEELARNRATEDLLVRVS